MREADSYLIYFVGFFVGVLVYIGLVVTVYRRTRSEWAKIILLGLATAVFGAWLGGLPQVDVMIPGSSRISSEGSWIGMQNTGSILSRLGVILVLAGLALVFFKQPTGEERQLRNETDEQQ